VIRTFTPKLAHAALILATTTAPAMVSAKARAEALLTLARFTPFAPSWTPRALAAARAALVRWETGSPQGVDTKGPPDFEHADQHFRVVWHPHAQMIGAATKLQMLGTASAHRGEPRDQPKQRAWLADQSKALVETLFAGVMCQRFGR
jgi:hypothetical protein